MEGVGSVEIHFVQDKFSQSHARVLCRSGVLLTQQQVIEIFEFGGEGLGPRVNAILAKQYGVTAKTIRDIRSGRRWGDLTTALARTRELKGGDFGGRPIPTPANTLSLATLTPERPLGFRPPPPGGCTVFSAIVRFMEAEARRSNPRWNAPFLSSHPAMRRQFNFGFRAGGILEVFNSLPLPTRQVVDSALLALQARGLAIDDLRSPPSAAGTDPLAGPAPKGRKPAP